MPTLAATGHSTSPASLSPADSAPQPDKASARAHQLRVPIAAAFPVEQIRAAVELQAGRHVHGKVVINL
jgi:hypothetical protein